MRVLVCGGAGGSGGYQRHLRGILSAGAIPPDASVHVLSSPQLAEKLGPVDPRVDVMQEPRILATSRVTRWRWWLDGYPSFVQRLRPDVILYPAPLVYGRDECRGIPCVVLSRNSLLFERRELLRYVGQRNFPQLLLFRARYVHFFRRAEGIIFISEYSMRHAMRAIRSARRKTVIYHGLDSSFLRPPPPTKQLGGRVELLYVSPILLYKHQWHVVAATDLLRRKLGLDIHLTLVGGAETTALRRLNQTIRALRASSYVTVSGDVAPSELASSYQSADIFVFASSCEACPTTLLEAMGSGLPIACSARGPMPEVLRDAGVYFDPEDVRSVASAIETLILDPQRRLECAAKAHEYAKKFTWRRCAEETFSFLQSIIELKGSPS